VSGRSRRSACYGHSAGRGLGLDAEDRPMVVADRSTTGFYALDWEAS
jgi:hypothetical protein